MRSSLLALAALTGLFVLVSAPGLVIGSVFFAAAVWVGWKLVTHRSGPLRRHGVRR
ncbi:hypothetical protein [Nocardia asiatica]